MKGFDKEAFTKIHEADDQITAVRFNPVKMIPDQPSLIPEILTSTVLTPVPWSSMGYYLSERPSFTLDPLFHAGLYYVQEPSSMFLEQVLKQKVDITKPLRILDCCAAPGGKSTLIQSVINKNSLLVANEVIRSRVNILGENLTKWGASNVIITNNDPKDFSRLSNYFDVILVDAPCSGSGLFRKEPEAVREWSEEKVGLCSRRQQRILSDIWPALKHNGILIYSTCSYSQEEDEDILDWMTAGFRGESLRIQVEDLWNIIETISPKTKGYGYRFYPHKLKGEGFFITAFQKNDGSSFHFPKPKKGNAAKLSKKQETILSAWIRDSPGITILKRNEFVYAIPSDMQDDIQFLESSLYIKKSGVMLGKIAHDELIPSHEFALSNLIGDQVQSVELPKEEALNYLRKREISVSATWKGWGLAKYQNNKLGWIKILQNRINNYYPADWRIFYK